MDKPRFKNFWIVITAAVFLVVLFLAIWLISLEASAQDLYDTYNQQQLLLVNGATSGIEGLFDDLVTSLNTLAKRPEIQYFDEVATRRELSQKLEEMNSLGIGDIGILDSSGTARFFAVKKELEGINLAWRSYYKTVYESSASGEQGSVDIALTPIEQGESGFTIAIPFFETAATTDIPGPSGDFAGVILGSLTLDTLISRHITPFKPPGDGHIYLMNQESDLIWSSDPRVGRINLVGSQMVALEGVFDQMNPLRDDTPGGSAYSFTPTSRREPIQLVAFSPVIIGPETLVIIVKTPAAIARQTSLTTFRSQQIVFILSLVTLLVGAVVGGLVLQRESKRRIQTEVALRQSEMAQAILKERNRLAGDLHDSVTQGLYGIVLHADAAIGQISAGDSDRASEYLQEIKETGKEGLAEMRLLIFELRPPVLEKEGLVPALEARLYAVEKRVGLEAEITSQAVGRLPKEIEEVFYRIAQEALNNVLKHAQAKHVQVNLNQRGRGLSMEIVDDGAGFIPTSLPKNIGMGLANMEDRAQGVGGNFRVESQPGKGTRIFVEAKI